MGKRRRKVFVPRTPEEWAALKQAIEFTGQATERGKLVFKDPISGGLYVYERNGLQPLLEGTRLVRCDLPFDVPER